MQFRETELKGAYIIEVEKIEDERGYFARSFCEHEFNDKGLNSRYVQSSISFNKKRGTLRGMHRQLAPYSEVKLVNCVRGAMLDVIIDLRRESDTFKKWISIELTPENQKTLYIPEGFAHGFLTLKDDTEVYYHMSEFFKPDVACGIRFNDPAFNIEWPQTERLIISEKDQNWKNFKA
jgi:dTDP-4-dehydrorhamnose 3,5-epimerase